MLPEVALLKHKRTASTDISWKAARIPVRHAITGDPSAFAVLSFRMARKHLGLEQRCGYLSTSHLARVAFSPPRVKKTARMPRVQNANAINTSGEGCWRVGVPSRKGPMNLDDALNAECIRIATTTARPDELNPYAISSDNPITNRIYIKGEELLQLTMNSGTGQRAHMTPTHIPAIQGGIIRCK